jgi:hypothetical protein
MTLTYFLGDKDFLSELDVFYNVDVFLEPFVQFIFLWSCFNSRRTGAVGAFCAPLGLLTDAYHEYSPLKGSNFNKIRGKFQENLPYGLIVKD